MSEVPPFLAFTTVFIFGAIVGSFLNVCIARIPTGESVMRPPSHCPKCKAPIPFYNNIPLISYFVLKGYCRSCSERISPRYFVVELSMALLAMTLYEHFGLSLAFFVSCVFVGALIVISFIDLDVRIVPDVISLPGIVLGLVFSLLARFMLNDPFELVPLPLSSILGVLIGGGFLLTLAWLYERFTGVEGMGGGDIKLLAIDSSNAFFCISDRVRSRHHLYALEGSRQAVRTSFRTVSLPRRASPSVLWSGFDLVLP
jgi:leader peptidase (prepilin peptidase)/N-methyltransferase